MAKLTTIRSQKMSRQRGRCYYCDAPMWAKDPRGFCRRHGVTLRSVKHFQRRAEHLTPRCDGGTDDPDNIVAACRYCNNRRHQMKRPPTAEVWLARVRARVERGTYRTVIHKRRNRTARA